MVMLTRAPHNLRSFTYHIIFYILFRYFHAGVDKLLDYSRSDKKDTNKHHKFSFSSFMF